MILRAAVVVLLAGAGLFWMNRFAPLQLPSVLAYSGLVVGVCGVLSLVIPPHWSGFSSRGRSLCAGLTTGMALVAAAWFWPAGSFAVSSPATRIDAFMPDYNFHERHEMVLNVSADAARRAMDQISFADIGMMQTLGNIRAVALRQPATKKAPPRVPIFQMMNNPHSGFFPLEDTPREFVFGLAGQPWSNSGVRLTPEEFRSWNKPGNVKIAANFLVEENSASSCRVITETRVLATDDTARRKMARYWALIYPGSGLIRRSLLEAVRDRASGLR